MYIIPYYIHRNLSEDFQLWTACVFMAKGGTKLWETDEPSLTQEEVINMYLQPNGLYGRVVCVKEGSLYFEVDMERTKLAEFYSWTDFLDKGEDIPKNLDVWRPILWLSEFNTTPGKKDVWGWHSETKNTFMHSIWNTLSQVLREVV